jgi:hypothetical protein
MMVETSGFMERTPLLKRLSVVVTLDLLVNGLRVFVNGFIGICQPLQFTTPAPVRQAPTNPGEYPGPCQAPLKSLQVHRH